MNSSAYTQMPQPVNINRLKMISFNINTRRVEITRPRPTFYVNNLSCTENLTDLIQKESGDYF